MKFGIVVSAVAAMALGAVHAGPLISTDSGFSFSFAGPDNMQAYVFASKVNNALAVLMGGDSPKSAVEGHLWLYNSPATGCQSFPDCPSSCDLSGSIADFHMIPSNAYLNGTARTGSVTANVYRVDVDAPAGRGPAVSWLYYLNPAGNIPLRMEVMRMGKTMMRIDVENFKYGEPSADKFVNSVSCPAKPACPAGKKCRACRCNALPFQPHGPPPAHVVPKDVIDIHEDA